MSNSHFRASLVNVFAVHLYNNAFKVKVNVFTVISSKNN
nr:MAG TPA: hypothetical protein [Caudoviricetes sp.]